MARLTDQQVTEIYRLASQGRSQRDIAEAIGCSHVAVGARLRQPPPAAPAPPQPVAPVVASPGSLVTRLTTLAGELEGIGEAGRAAVCREAVAALAEPDEPDDELPPDDADALQVVRHLVTQNRSAYLRCVESGFETAAQRYSRTIAQLAPVLARLEKAAVADNDSITIQRSEIEAAKAKVAERLSTLASQPLCCQRCGAELRMQTALTEAGVDAAPQ